MSEPAVTTNELTHLEFRASLPCEHSQHGATETLGGHEGDQAIWDYRFRCPCGRTAHALVCDGLKVHMRATAIICDICGQRHIGGIGVATFDPIVETAP